MGGRGASFEPVVVNVGGGSGGNGSMEELIVAGMTPTYKGSRYTQAKKTLQYIESKKRSYEKEQLQILDDYGYITKAFQGDEHSVSVTPEAIAYMRDKIVTHNHPADWGGTFSGADISMLQTGVCEMRASAKEGTYILRRKKKADPKAFYQDFQSNTREINEQMRAIADNLAKKKWSSKKAYNKAQRKAQLDVVHEWYSHNAERYGYEYLFEEVKKDGGKINMDGG